MLKPTGPITKAGKQRSRCNATRHSLAAETMIGALDDAEEHRALEVAAIADYDVQSAVERELVRRRPRPCGRRQHLCLVCAPEAASLPASAFPQNRLLL
jgi:hypothetical protein